MKLKLRERGVTLAAVAALAFGPGCKTPATAGESAVLEAGFGKIEVCTGSRKFSMPGAQGFDFKARELSLPDAYWLSVMSVDAYSQKDLVLAELQRQGFQNSFFFDEDGVARNVLQSGMDFRWASTQGFWAERPDGIILAFRGTIPSEIGDVVTDIWSNQSSLSAIGAEAIGTLADAAVSAAGDTPGGSLEVPAGSTLNVHKGFWYALDIIWKDLEAHAKKLYDAERPKEIAFKQAQLDAWGAKLAHGDLSGLKAALAADTEWRIDVNGKLNLLRTWNTLGHDAGRRADLFGVIDQNWTSSQKPIFITGHSLGGGLATLAAYRLMKMGLNVRGLYTYGSPRVGNGAFIHEMRMLAFHRGLKSKGTSHAMGDGGMQRFVNHLDAVARVPPSLGFMSESDNAAVADTDRDWAHVSSMRYLTGSETPTQELWLEGDDRYADRFNASGVPAFTANLPLESWKQWGSDHDSHKYAAKLEQVAFGTRTACPGS